MTKRIAFLIFSDGIGGAEKVVQKIAQAAHENGSNVIVIVNEEIFDFFIEKSNGFKVFSIGSLYLLKYQKRFQKVVDIAKIVVSLRASFIDDILVRNNIDVAISNLMYDLKYLAECRLSLSKVAVIHGAIGIDKNQQKYVFSAVDTHSLLEKVDNIVCVSQSISAILNNVDKLRSKVTIINNGTNIRLESFLAVDDRGLNEGKKQIDFLFCGGDKPVKGGEILRSALLLLFNKTKYFSISIAGPISKKSFWYDINEKYPEQVKVLGFLTEKELLDKIYQADCVVMPSISEGDPLVAIDAIALGTPILSSDIDSFRSIVSDKYRFKLTEIDISNKMLEFIESSDFRNDYKYLKGKRTWQDVWTEYLKVI